MCHFFVYFLYDENAALLCAHMKFMKTKGSGCLCTSRLWLKLWSLAALMAEGERATWKVLGLHGTKTEDFSVKFSERQNVALPSFCCLSSRFKIFYLPCSHGVQRHSRKDRTWCSDQYRSTIWPKTVTFRGHECFVCVCVCEWKRTFLCIFPCLNFSSFASKAKVFLKTDKCADVFLGSTPNTI